MRFKEVCRRTKFSEACWFVSVIGSANLLEISREGLQNILDEPIQEISARFFDEHFDEFSRKILRRFVDEQMNVREPSCKNFPPFQLKNFNDLNCFIFAKKNSFPQNL